MRQIQRQNQSQTRLKIFRRELERSRFRCSPVFIRRETSRIPKTWSNREEISSWLGVASLTNRGELTIMRWKDLLNLFREEDAARKNMAKKKDQDLKLIDHHLYHQGDNSYQKPSIKLIQDNPNHQGIYICMLLRRYLEYRKFFINKKTSSYFFAGKSSVPACNARTAAWNACRRNGIS